MTERLLLVVLTLALVLCAMGLVTAQQRARNAFVDLERAQTRERELVAEGDRLRIDLGRASQPAAIESAARQQGLRPLDPARAVLLPLVLPPASSSSSSRETVQ